MRADITETKLLTPDDRKQIVERLTKPDGQFVRVFGEDYKDKSLPIVLLREGDDDRILAWAASETWQGYEAIEAFTDKDHRRRGLAVTAAVILSVVQEELLVNPIAVFSPEMIPVVIRAGLVNATLFSKDGEGNWQPLAHVKSIQEPSGGPPSALGVLVGD